MSSVQGMDQSLKYSRKACLSNMSGAMDPGVVWVRTLMCHFRTIIAVVSFPKPVSCSDEHVHKGPLCVQRGLHSTLYAAWVVTGAFGIITMLILFLMKYEVA